jgi:uncharacterized protein YecE (DUF72 family)
VPQPIPCPGLPLPRSRASLYHVPPTNDAPGIHLGTSAFTAAGWEDSFYPEGMKPADYLTYYATKFDTVEVDSTFYRTPSAATVNGWARKTPDGFLFSVKVPQSITHEKMLVGAEAEFKQFVETMDLLGPKLGPMVLQFPYFNRTKFKSGGEFLKLLAAFIKKLPSGHQFAVEIRNKSWLDARFAGALRDHNVALVLQDHSWMPRPAQLFEQFDPITVDFTYIRWLGDRKGIEERTKTWDVVIVDRTRELAEWVEIVRKVHKRRIQIFAYANNHYAGHAPATVEQFQQMLGPLEPPKPRRMEKERSLFD